MAEGDKHWPNKRFDLIERKLKAIRDKDVAKIVREQIYLPISNVLTSQNEAERIVSVGAWLKRRINTLEKAKVLSESAIADEINTLYETLCDNCKKIVDSQLTGEPITTPSCDKDYETLCTMQLYQFSLGVF